MKKLVALLLSLCLAFGMLAVASAETKTGAAQGFGSEVKVTVTVEDGKITAIDVDDSGETYPVAREDSVEKSSLRSSKRTALTAWTSTPALPSPAPQSLKP